MEEKMNAFFHITIFFLYKNVRISTFDKNNTIELPTYKNANSEITNKNFVHKNHYLQNCDQYIFNLFSKN